MEPLNILFVCTGNICRSPMAEGIARGALRRFYPSLEGEVEISSAGVAALDGGPATAGAIEAMRLRGLDIRGHAARSLDYQLMSRADLALVMEEGQRRIAARVGGGAGARVFLLLKLGEAAGSLLKGIDGLSPGGDATERVRRLACAARETEEDGAWSRPDQGYEVGDPLGMPVTSYAGTADAMEQPIFDILRALLSGRGTRTHEA